MNKNEKFRRIWKSQKDNILFVCCEILKNVKLHDNYISLFFDLENRKIVKIVKPSTNWSWKNPENFIFLYASKYEGGLTLENSIYYFLENGKVDSYFNEYEREEKMKKINSFEDQEEKMRFIKDNYKKVSQEMKKDFFNLKTEIIKKIIVDKFEE